jgi:hypothetical protein
MKQTLFCNKKALQIISSNIKDDIKDLVENYMNKLNYKCAGLYFKNMNNFSDNYLFIFPECRSDSKILNNGGNGGNINNIDNKIINDDDDDDLFKNVEIIKVERNVEKKIEKKIEKNNLKLEKTTCKFLIHPTAMPDIYELYCKNNNNNIEKYNYAAVPDIETSNFLKNLLNNNYNMNEDIHTKVLNSNGIYVECNYHKSFKKWIPYKKVDSMDNINCINQIQIILDSL